LQSKHRAANWNALIMKTAAFNRDHSVLAVPDFARSPTVAPLSISACRRDRAALRPDHAVWFYIAAGVVLVLGLLGIWAASAGKRVQTDS